MTLVPYQNLPVKKTSDVARTCSLTILTFYEITPFPTTQHAKLCPLVVCFDPCLLVGMAVRASAVGLDFLVVGLYLWLRLRHQSHLPTARYCGGRLSSTPAQGKLFFCTWNMFFAAGFHNSVLAISILKQLSKQHHLHITHIL